MAARRIMATVAIAAGTLAWCVPIAASASDTVQGELVTIMCVAKNGAKGQGAAHVDCAVDCAKKGYPLAILTADGAMYKITGPLTADDNVKLQPLLAATVVATGRVGGDQSDRTIDADSVVRAER
jgi:hypothetical protein